MNSKCSTNACARTGSCTATASTSRPRPTTRPVSSLMSGPSTWSRTTASQRGNGTAIRAIKEREGYQAWTLARGPGPRPDDEQLSTGPWNCRCVTVCLSVCVTVCVCDGPSAQGDAILNCLWMCWPEPTAAPGTSRVCSGRHCLLPETLVQLMGPSRDHGQGQGPSSCRKLGSMHYFISL